MATISGVKMMLLMGLAVALVGGCGGQAAKSDLPSPGLPETPKPPPAPHLNVVAVENDFDQRDLPNVIDVQLDGRQIGACSLELFHVENGEKPESGRLELEVPDSGRIAGRARLVLTSRPDPNGNQRALFDQEVYGFSLAARLVGCKPLCLGGPLEVSGKHAGALQANRARRLEPDKAEVLLVQWFGPLFDGPPEDCGPADPPPTLDAIVKKTADNKKLSAVVLVVIWSAR